MDEREKTIKRLQGRVRDLTMQLSATVGGYTKRVDGVEAERDDYRLRLEAVQGMVDRYERDYTEEVVLPMFQMVRDDNPPLYETVRVTDSVARELGRLRANEAVLNAQIQELERRSVKDGDRIAELEAENAKMRERLGETVRARKWANLFETPEKLEEAYRHLYRAYHERSREMGELKAENAGLREWLKDEIRIYTIPGMPMVDDPTFKGCRVSNEPLLCRDSRVDELIDYLKWRDNPPYKQETVAEINFKYALIKAGEGKG